jgi:hypothetical protein
MTEKTPVELTGEIRYRYYDAEYDQTSPIKVTPDLLKKEEAECAKARDNFLRENQGQNDTACKYNLPTSRTFAKIEKKLYDLMVANSEGIISLDDFSEENLTPNQVELLTGVERGFSDPVYINSLNNGIQAFTNDAFEVRPEEIEGKKCLVYFRKPIEGETEIERKTKQAFWQGMTKVKNNIEKGEYTGDELEFAQEFLRINQSIFVLVGKKQEGKVRVSEDLATCAFTGSVDERLLLRYGQDNYSNVLNQVAKTYNKGEFYVGYEQKDGYFWLTYRRKAQYNSDLQF